MYTSDDATDTIDIMKLNLTNQTLLFSLSGAQIVAQWIVSVNVGGEKTGNQSFE